MKIVHILPAINKGGTERIVLSLAQIQQKKHQVSVIVFSDINHYPEQSKGIDIRYITEPTYVEYSLFGIKNQSTKALHNTLKDINPEIIHSHSYWTDLLLTSLPKLRANYISHLHLYYNEYKSAQYRISKSAISHIIDKYRIFSQFKKYGFHFITISKDIHEYYKKLFPRGLNSKFHLIKNAVDLSDFNTREGINRSLGAKKTFNLLNVSRLVPFKNHLFLIEVAKQLLIKGFTNCKIIIAGEGPERKLIANAISKNGLEKYIVLKGNVNDIANAYKQADLYIHCAIKEPFGLTFLEAHACGLPTIAIKAGGNEDIVENGINGYLLENNAEEFAIKIIELLGDNDFYQKLSNNALENVKKFNFDSYCSNVEKLYQSITLP